MDMKSVHKNRSHVCHVTMTSSELTRLEVGHLKANLAEKAIKTVIPSQHCPFADRTTSPRTFHAVRQCNKAISGAVKRQHFVIADEKIPVWWLVLATLVSTEKVGSRLLPLMMRRTSQGKVAPWPNSCHIGFEAIQKN
ncbi:hypothetical protein HNY73_004376 [Argiope bruennichi]|uniref:Uncharacterized protein n=1 Tax=Argiope bruennichi TaxID=94029 RepID=A0A8T0FVP1_ARGBR|nr:hypothetical protein HNY73_004376 [Argiope bruennichi]